MQKTTFMAVTLILSSFLLVSGAEMAQAGCPCEEWGSKVANAKAAHDAAPSDGTVAICPVSGEAFTVTKDTERTEHDGKHYVFCSSQCKPKFDADPGKYVGKKKGST